MSDSTTVVDDGSRFEARDLPLTMPLLLNGIAYRLDHRGMIPAGNGFGGGLYYQDTRHLSTLEWRLGGRPLRMVPGRQRGGVDADFRYGNMPLQAAGGAGIPEHHIRVWRGIVLHAGSIYEQILVTNSHCEPVQVALELQVGMDAAHLFHVRGFGFALGTRGELLPPRVVRTGNASGLLLGYRAKSGHWFHTLVEYLLGNPTLVGEAAPDRESHGVLSYHFDLRPAQQGFVEVKLTPFPAQDEPLVNYDSPSMHLSPPQLPTAFDQTDKPRSYGVAVSGASAYRTEWSRGHTRIDTSNRSFNRLLRTAETDLHTLWLITPEGNTFAAGNPWYVCPFGRDSAVTGGQVQLFMPGKTRDVLDFHARHLGTRRDEKRAQWPGKAFHEQRAGELALLGKIDHGLEPYYGTIDGTPLFLRLFASYVLSTGDLAFARQQWPQIELALGYITQELERGSGWLVYGLDPEQALKHQGWKDSDFGIRRGDGSPSRHPIALVEVQAYLYQALRDLARVCDVLARTASGSPGDSANRYGDRVNPLRSMAADLQSRFLSQFVTPDGFLALALDAQGPNGVTDKAMHQVQTVTTNAGHALATGILPDDLARSVARRLALPDMLHRWGLVATSSHTTGWNPEGYHDGVWVWDNAEVVKGLFLIGATELAHQIIERHVRLARQTPDGRLPEPICGYNSKQHRPWPQACVPQAWSAGAPFQWVASMLGLEPDGIEGVLRIVRPSLPAFLEWLTVEGLSVGSKAVDLRFVRDGGATKVEVINNASNLTVEVS